MCQSGEKRVLLLVIYIQFNNYSTQCRIFSQEWLLRNNFFIVTCGYELRKVKIREFQLQFFYLIIHSFGMSPRKNHFSTISLNNSGCTNGGPWPVPGIITHRQYALLLTISRADVFKIPLSFSLESYQYISARFTKPRRKFKRHILLQYPVKCIGAHPAAIFRRLRWLFFRFSLNIVTSK